MSNNLRTRDGLPFNFVDGIMVGGVDLSGNGGAGKVGYEQGVSVEDVLDNSFTLATRDDLRAYSGRAKSIRLTSSDMAGFYVKTNQEVSDNAKTIIAGVNNWIRVFEEDKVGVTINALCNHIANCKIDGVTDDFASMRAIFDYIKTNQLRNVEVHLPYTGNKMLLSECLEISYGYTTLKINCDIALTKTQYVDGSSVIYFKPLDDTEVPLKNIKIIGDNITIDGNGRNFTDIPPDGYINVRRSSCITVFACEYVYIAGIHAYNGLGFGVDINQCRYYLVEDCEFSYALRENGFGSNFFPYWNLPRIDGVPQYELYDSEDPEWYSYGYIRRCRSHHNTDVGISSFSSNGVVFEDCLTWENGNNGLDGQYNAGGGYTAEGSHSTTVDKYLNVQFIRCSSINDKHYGFFSDHKVNVSYTKCVVKNVTSSALQGDPPNPIRRASFWKVMSGTGGTVRLHDCVGDGSDDASMIVFGNKIIVTGNSEFKNAAKQALYAYGIIKLKYKGVLFENNGFSGSVSDKNLFFISAAPGPSLMDVEIDDCVFDGAGYSSIGRCKRFVLTNCKYYSNYSYMNTQSFMEAFPITNTSVAITKNNTFVYTPTGSETLVGSRFYDTVESGIMKENDTLNCITINQALTIIGNNTGPTSARPSGSTRFKGMYWFDETLSIPIWWDGTVWQDSQNTAV